MSYCPCCPQSQHTFGISMAPSCCDHQPTVMSSDAIYQQACYHYQSYLYYWNMCNTQNTHSSAPCECYEDSRQSSSCHFPGYSNQSKDCIDSNVFQTKPRHFSSYDEFENTGNNSHYTGHQGGHSDYDCSHNDYNNDDCDDDDDDDDDDEFEVDESFYQFLKQSQKHKKERERSKRELSKKDEYIEVGKKQISASTLPPEEHQESKRKKAMEELYGAQASFIMSLETSVQLHFDKNFDDRQPIFWPNIPLKF